MAPKRKRSEDTATAAATRPRRESTRPALPLADGLTTDKKATFTNKTSEAPKASARKKAKQQIALKVKSKIPAIAGPKTGAESTPKSKAGKAPKAKAVANDDPPDGREAGGRSFWLMKAEPESRLEKGIDVKFSIDDLAACAEPEAWDGVRNVAARNNMRAMKKGDLAFFYHSSCKVPGVVGLMEIVKEHSTDEAAFNPKHPYFDKKSSRDVPKWSVVHVEFRQKFNSMVRLKDLQAKAKEEDSPLKEMQVLRMSRLSVSKVPREEWECVLTLAGIDPASV